MVLDTAQTPVTHFFLIRKEANIFIAIPIMQKKIILIENCKISSTRMLETKNKISRIINCFSRLQKFRTFQEFCYIFSKICALNGSLYSYIGRFAEKSCEEFCEDYIQITVTSITPANAKLWTSSFQI